MESLFCVFSFTSVLNRFSRKFDILGNLPPELCSQILRMLDSNMLMNAALVNERLCDLCYADPVLRKRLRQYLRETKAQREVKENCTPGSDYYAYSFDPRRSPLKPMSSQTRAVTGKFAGKRKRPANRRECTSHKKAKTLRL